MTTLLHVRPMAGRDPLGPASPTAKRLKALRQSVTGANASTFAKEIGLSPQRWNNFETGFPLSKDVAITLVQKFPGLTLDWLYLGKRDGLTLEMAARLGSSALDAEAESERPTTQRRA